MDNARPRTLGDFKRLGAKKRAGRSAQTCKRIHDEREARRPDVLDPLRMDGQPTRTREVWQRLLRTMDVVPLGEAASDLQEQVRGRKRNWELPKASRAMPVRGWFVRDIDNGKYSSRCTYTHWTYELRVTSVAFVRPGFIWFWFANDARREFKAPRGYRWDSDSNGLRLVANANEDHDYHPTAADLIFRGVKWIVGQIKANAAARRATAAKMRQEQSALWKAEREGATVCLADSLRAGNCRAGSEQWAQRHGLDPRRHYKPSEVLALANGDTHKVALVASVALRRHRLEMERGYAVLAEHRVN